MWACLQPTKTVGGCGSPLCPLLAHQLGAQSATCLLGCSMNIS